MRELASALLGLALLASVAEAQDAGAAGLAVPPPPGAPVGASPPSAPTFRGVPLDFLVGPLLMAAEEDLTAGRVPLAMARASIVASVLPADLPLRVRADGMRLIAAQRMPESPSEPPADEVLAPMIVQSELDLRAAQPQVALARLDFVLARLPTGSPLFTRARQLRGVAASRLGVAPPPAASVPVAAPPALPSAPRHDDGRRGTGEIVELYITAAGLGALTGGYLPFVTTNGGASGTTYVFTTLAGAGLFAVGVLSLDLTMRLPSGVPPTISASIPPRLRSRGARARALRRRRLDYRPADELQPGLGRRDDWRGGRARRRLRSDADGRRSALRGVDRVLGRGPGHLRGDVDRVSGSGARHRAEHGGDGRGPAGRDDR